MCGFSPLARARPLCGRGHPHPRPLHAQNPCGGLRVRGPLLRLRGVPDPSRAPVSEERGCAALPAHPATKGWTAIQQMKYLEALERVALEDGTHLRTSSSVDEIHVAPINCAPEADAWDITHTFLKAGRVSGLTADISNLEPVHVAKAPTDPADAGFKRAVADGDLARSFRTWTHTFVTKALALASGLLAAANEAEADWVKPAARFASFQATSAAAGAKGIEESKGGESKSTDCSRRWRSRPLKRTRA